MGEEHVAVPSVAPSALAVIAGTEALAAAAALGRLPHVVVGEHIAEKPIRWLRS